MVLKLRDDGFHALFKISPIPGAGKDGTHVKRKHGRVGKYVGDFSRDDPVCQALGNRGFPDTRVPDQNRVVLSSAAQDLDTTFDFVVPPDQRVEISVPGALIHVDAEFFDFAGSRFSLSGVLGRRRNFLDFAGSGDGSDIAKSRLLGDAVRNEVDRIVTRHVLLLQEIGRVALALGKYGDEQVCARHFVPVRIVDMGHRPFDDAGKGAGW